MVRKIQKKDRELFLQLAKEFYHSEAVLEPIPEQFHETTFAELMRAEEYLQCFILEREETAAGYALLNISYSQEAGGRVVWLEELYLRPEYQGQGLGSEFFDYLEKEIPAARYRLEVEPDNLRAVELYKRKGFRQLPYLQMYHQISVDE